MRTLRKSRTSNNISISNAQQNRKKSTTESVSKESESKKVCIESCKWQITFLIGWYDD